MKIFEFNQGQKGTLIDSVSKTAGTFTAGNGGFKKTEKGLSLLGDGTATQVVTELTLPFAYTDTFTFETYIKCLDTNGGYVFSNASLGGFGLYITSMLNYKMLNVTIDTTSAHTTLKLGQWYHIIGVFSNGSITYYLNNTADGTVSGFNFATSTTKLNLLNRPSGSTSGTFFKGYVSSLKFFNTALSSKERNNLYKEFLQASPTEKEVRGFEYPKPTDLSHLKDSVLDETITLEADREFTSITGNWTLSSPTNINTTEGILNINSPDGVSRAASYGTLINGQKYILTYNVLENRAGSLQIYYGAAVLSIPSTVGKHTVEFTANGAIFNINRRSSERITDIDIGYVSLKKVNGLVAAYSFNPETVSKGTLLDISGNGNHGTINGALLTKDGMKFGNNSMITTSGTNLDLITQTVCYRFNSMGITGNASIYRQNLTNKFKIMHIGDLLLVSKGSAVYDSSVVKIPQLINSEWNDIVVVYTGSLNATKVYFNGVYAGELTNILTGYGDVGTITIGNRIDNAYSFKGKLADLKIYNYAFTPEQAKAYHNSFVKPVLIEDFSNHPANSTNPKGWIAGTGAYKISESLDKGKYLECTTAGTTAMQSKTAYGEWEFDVYKGDDANSTTIPFISDRANATLDGANGYNFRVNTNEQVVLDLNNDGSHTAKIVTAASYISNNTWYRLKIARLQSGGVFKDIPTLQTGDLANSEGGAKPYTTFISNGRYGFSAISNGSDITIAGTADEISLTSSAKYLVEFDLKLNSGTAPDIALKANTGLTGNISNTVTTANGRNSIILTATTTTTGALGFYNSSTASDYTISGLTIRRIYPANTFAVFIKGGAYGNTETGWTLVDTTGGSGTNPVVDSTYTTSEYFVTDLDAGDRIGNISILNGVKI